MVVAIGVDRGFGDTKYYSSLENGKGVISSLIAPVSERRAREIMDNNSDDPSLIIYKKEGIDGPEYYLIGRYVATLEPTYAERDLRRDRMSLNETILFQVGMGLATGAHSKIDVVVTTGLPTEDLDRLRDVYIAHIENGGIPHCFSIFIGNVEYKKEVLVRKANVENQPKGTVIAVLTKKLLNHENWSEVKQYKYGICDVGFLTTDLSMYIGKDIIHGEGNNFSTFGVSDIVKHAKKEIEDNFKCKKSEDEILTALITNTIKSKGKMLDCSKQVSNTFAIKGKKLVDEIHSKWQSYLDTLDELVLTGGGVQNEMFFEVLKSEFKTQLDWEIYKLDNSQLANAKGFSIISQTSQKTLGL